MTRLIATELLDDSESSRMDFGSTIADDADDDLGRRARRYIIREEREAWIERSRAHLLPTSVRPSFASRFRAEVVDVLHHSSKSSKEELVVLLWKRTRFESVSIGGREVRGRGGTNVVHGENDEEFRSTRSFVEVLSKSVSIGPGTKRKKVSLWQLPEERTEM